MKKFTATMVILCVVLAAGFAVAGDARVGGDGAAVGLDNHNTNTLNGINTNTNTANGTGTATANAPTTITTPRDFVGLPSAPNLMGAPLILGLEGCIPILGTGMNAEFSIKRIENMKAGSFLEKKGGWWHGLWSSRIKSSVEVPFEGDKRHGGPVRLINWDLAKAINPGDMSLGTFNCEGDYGYPLNATLGMCLSEAYETTNTERVYVCYTIRRDAHSSGTAYSGAGGTSTIPHSGNAAFAGSVAATFGTSASYANVAYDVTLVALNRGSAEFQGMVSKPAPEKSVDVPVTIVPKGEQPAPEACNPEEFEKIIRDLEDNGMHDGHRWCKWPGENNQDLRFRKGNAFSDKGFCEKHNGKGKEVYIPLFLKAEHEFGVAERDFNNGRELAKGQKFGDKPKGVLTPTLPSARELDYKVHYNQALVVRELNGEAAEIAHAHKYGLGEKGTKDMPTEWADMKR